ncbi:MAG TPA: hypothetical protein VGK01_17875 [Candidatus Angelobacter sp.]
MIYPNFRTAIHLRYGMVTVIDPIGTVMLLEDASTVTMTTFDCGIGAGVGVGDKTEVLPPPPPHAVRLNTITNAAKIAARTSGGRRSPGAIRDGLTAHSKSTQTTNPAISNHLGPLPYTDNSVVDAGRAVTLTVRAVLKVPLVGKVPVAGLKVHESPAGNPGQLNANMSVRPFWELNERLNVLELPTGIVADLDEMVLLTP